MKGRKPVPAALRLVTTKPAKLKGHPATHAPQPASPVGPPPDDLSEGAKAVWRHVVDNSPPGMLTALERHPLEAYCVAVALHQDARRKVDTAGLIVKSPKAGVPMQNPFLPIVNRQAEIARQWAAELGLTPTARVRLGAKHDETKQPDDPYRF